MTAARDLRTFLKHEKFTRDQILVIAPASACFLHYLQIGNRTSVPLGFQVRLYISPFSLFCHLAPYEEERPSFGTNFPCISACLD